MSAAVLKAVRQYAARRLRVSIHADDPEVAIKLHMKGASAADVFGELRERKNKS